MKKIFILFLTLIVSFFLVEKNTPVKAEGVPILDKLGEISKIQVVDSVGRFEKISNKKYKYTYVKLSYNEEFEYYYHPNATTESIDISLSDMPKLAFDSNENLINGYYSINNNYWYKCEVIDKTNTSSFNWTYKKIIVPNPFVDNERLCFFEIYFNFNFNYDVVFELAYKLPLYYDQVIGKDLFVSNFECNLRCDEYVRDMSISIWDEILPLIGVIKSFSKKEKPVIENGKFIIDNKEYDCKTTFIDNEYYLFNAHVGIFNGNEIVSWENSNVNSPTLFNPRYFPDNENADGTKNPLDASCVYSYKGVLYSFEGLDGNLNRPDDRPIADSRDPLDKLKDLLPDYSLPSWVKSLIIILVILLIVLFIVFVFSKIRQNQLLKYQVKKEKTISRRES